MAKLFNAFDRTHYTELCTLHLADLWLFPESVLEHFKRGAFTVSVKVALACDQALDEAHESIVNLQTKKVLNSSEPVYFEQVAHYLPHHAVLTQNLKREILPGTTATQTLQYALNINIDAIRRRFGRTTVFGCIGDLQNEFTGKSATKRSNKECSNARPVANAKCLPIFKAELCISQGSMLRSDRRSSEH